jgi:plasmid stabilization system protein ParE
VSYRIVLTPEAEAQLGELCDYVAGETSIEVANRYVDAILARIAGLTDFPHRGTPHDDIRPGLRTIPFRRRLTIAYQVVADEVRIAGIFYAGQDFEAMMRDD